MQHQLEKENFIGKIAKLNWLLISLIAILSTIGLTMLYSANWRKLQNMDVETIYLFFFFSSNDLNCHY